MATAMLCDGISQLCCVHRNLFAGWVRTCNNSGLRVRNTFCPFLGSDTMGSLSNQPSENDLMATAINEGCNGVTIGAGGPFGAIITQNGKIISRGHNRVLQTNDPTAHAEIVAIRDACARLGRFSLHDCVIYSSCLPCPMCFSAIHWAKLPRCVYSGSPEDAAAVGFDDRFLYDTIRGKAEQQKCVFEELKHESNNKPFQIYSDLLARNESGRY